MLGCVLRSACSCAAASAATAVARHDCCVVVVDHVVAVAATLVFTVASDCCAAASAAAVVARHARRYFFFKHQADVSSTGIGFMHLGGVRKLHVFRVVPTMASVYLGQLHVLHPLNTDDDRLVQSALLPPTDHRALSSHHHRHITVRIEHRRDHIHVSRFAAAA